MKTEKIFRICIIALLLGGFVHKPFYSFAQDDGFQRTMKNRYRLIGLGGPSVLRLASVSNQISFSATLATEIDASNAMQIISDLAMQAAQADTKGRTLGIDYVDGNLETAGALIFAGDEVGFGIPDPPLDFTVTKNSDASKMVFSWMNPSSGYEQIILLHSGAKSAVLAAPDISFVQNFITDTSKGASSYYLQGYMLGDHATVGSELERRVRLPQGSRPSNVGIAVLDTSTPLVVTEKDDIPFTNGVTQNWSRWNSSQAAPLKCRMGEKIHKSGKRTYYQIVHGQGSGFSGGIKRRLLGLSPGQTYRLKLQVSTLMTDPGDWKFTVHAVSLPSDIEELTPEQMAGTVPLPNGNTGEAAAQMAAYGSNQPSGLTLGRTIWKNRYTNEQTADNLITDIQIPEGHDKIAIWLRLAGSGENVQVGFDYLEYELLE